MSEVKGAWAGACLILKGESGRHPGSALSGGLVLVLFAGATAYADGRTIIDVSYDYAQVRLRPTYDGNIRGTRRTQLELSGQKTISVRQSNQAGKNAAEWTENHTAGSGESSWRFTGRNQLTKVTDWPQSTTTTVINVSSSGTCTVRVTDTLKPGFTEFKHPMLSRNEFGYYQKTRFSNFSCKIRNEN